MVEIRFNAKYFVPIEDQIEVKKACFRRQAEREASSRQTLGEGA
jgi:hypothetical protein